jgi:hypothetical protein
MGTYLSHIRWKTGLDTNVSHLRAHVSDLLGHTSEHMSTQFDLVGARMCRRVLMGFVLAPFSQLKHDPNTQLTLKYG